MTDVPSFEALEAKFMTPLQYGVTLTLKLAPVAIFLGVKYLLPKITARFASTQVSTSCSMSYIKIGFEDYAWILNHF